MTRKIAAVCLDCGDTLADEGTEVKDANEVTLRADLIPGAAQMVRGLKARRYPLALVADGPAGTFHNILTQHALHDAFDAFAISQEVGVLKPDPLIFHHAMAQLHIPDTDYYRVVMVGNNLERDIKGANALGMISVWLDWAPRRAKVPRDASEIPQYTIKAPLDLLSLIDQLEQFQEKPPP